MKPHLRLYIGSDESFNDFVCVDLLVSGKSFNIYTSEIILSDASEEDFLFSVGNALNIVLLVCNGLGIFFVTDEEIFNVSEEFSGGCLENIKKLLKENK